MTVQAPLLTYDDALHEFLATRGTFGGGLSNHGPMATEALDHMGVPEWIGPFVTHYRTRLEPRTPPPTADVDWRQLLADVLPGVVASAAAEAGHTLLRVAHAVRGIERAEADGAAPAVRIDELRTALRRWQAAAGLPAPAALTGDRTIDDWSAALAPLANFEPAPGLLTVALGQAAEQPGFVDAVASLRPSDRAHDTLDRLARRALDGYLANDEPLARFTLLHGVTVSTMARELVDHLDRDGQRRLEAAVAGFVAAAAIAFDRRTDRAPAAAAPATAPTGGTDAGVDLAARAAATLDDHTIKFTDACLGLAARTGDDLPLRAAAVQIALTS